MKRIKDYRTKKEKEKVEEKEPTISFTPENNEIPLRNTGTPYDFELEYFTIKNKLSVKHEILYEESESTIKI